MAEAGVNPFAKLNRYEVKHLVEHLECAGRVEDLHRLLRQEYLTAGNWVNAWEDAHGRFDDAEGFVADVSRAWRATRRDAAGAPLVNERAQHIGRDVRYLLIHASLVSAAEKMSPATVGNLVQLGRWSVTRGLFHSANLPRAEQRAETLAWVAPYVTDGERAQAVELATNIPDPLARMWGFCALATHCRGEATICRAAVDAAEAIPDPCIRSLALAGLGLLLPAPWSDESRRKSVSAADSIERSKSAVALEDMVASGANEARGRLYTLDEQVEKFVLLQRWYLARLAKHFAETGRYERAFDAVMAMGIRALPLRVCRRLPNSLRNRLARLWLTSARRTRAPVDKIILSGELLREVQADFGDEASITHNLRIVLNAPAAAFLAEWQTFPSEVRRAILQAIGPWMKGCLAEALPNWTFDLDSELTEYVEEDTSLKVEINILVAATGTGPASVALLVPAALAVRGYEEEAFVLLKLLGAKSVLKNYLGTPRKDVLGATLPEHPSHMQWSDVFLLPIWKELTLARFLLGTVRTSVTRGIRAALPKLVRFPLGPLRGMIERATLRSIALTHVPWDRVAALRMCACHLSKVALPEAVQLARGIDAPKYRLPALVALMPGLVGPLREEVLAEVTAAITAVRTEDDRARILASLEPLLQGGAKQKAICAAWLIRDPLSRATALSTLGMTATDEEITGGAGVVSPEVLDDGDIRSESLAMMAPYVPGLPLSELSDGLGSDTDEAAVASMALAFARAGDPHSAVATARMIQAPEKRACSLIALLPFLNPPSLALAVEVALSALENSDDGANPADHVAEMGPFLSGPTLERGVKLALTGVHAQTEKNRAEAAITLARGVGRALDLAAVTELLEVIGTITDSRTRDEAFAEVSRAFAARADAACSLLAVGRITNEVRRVRVFTDLAPCLRGLRFPEDVMPIVSRLSGPRLRVEVLAAVIPQVPEQATAALAQAKKEANSISDPWYRANALVTLAGYVAEEAGAAFQECVGVSGMGNRFSLFSRLVPYLRPDLRDEAFGPIVDVARAMAKPDERALALASLIPHAADGLRHGLLCEALESALELSDPRKRAETLLAFFSHLPEPVADQVQSCALESACAIKAPKHRTDVLVKLLPHLKSELCDTALAVGRNSAVEIADLPVRASTFLAFGAPEQALAAAEEIVKPETRVNCLVSLIPSVTAAWTDHALKLLLESVRAIGTEFGKKEMLSDLPARLAGRGAVVAALQVARAIEDRQARRDVLLNLAPSLVGLPVGSLFSLWAGYFPVLSPRSRSDVVSDLAGLTPLLHALAPQALWEVVRAMSDVGRWWP